MLFGTCPGELVTSIAIVQPNAAVGTAEGGDIVLWRASSAQGVSARKFEVSNQAPPNMRSDVALNGSLPSGVTLVAEVTTDHRPGVNVEFSLSDIASDKVFTSDNESESESTFLERASADCNS